MSKRATPQAMSVAAVAFALAAFSGAASAIEGYVSGSADPLVTSPYGICWKTASWNLADAVPPCDGITTVQAVVPVVAAAPEPAPPPVTQAAPITPAPVIEKLTLDADVLFEFDKATLRPQGRQQLQALVDRLKSAQVESILTVGYADPIGQEQYNKKLSQERADSVRDFLAQNGVDRTVVRTEGRGETQEFTGGECKGLKGNKLISCLQPNRRVDIEVRGTRVAGTGEAPSAGSGTTVPSMSPASGGTGSGTGTR